MTRDVRELGGAWTKYQRHAFPSPSPGLARYVAHYWAVEWEYDRPYRQHIVPYPNVHLTFRDGRAIVNGVSSGHQIKVLDGRGRVFGVAFRPGCFRPFLRAPVSTITDRAIDAAGVLGPGLPWPAGPPGVEDVERLLRACAPEPDPAADDAAHIVALVAAEPGITRVDALARRAGMSVRRLQRLFSEYVGIGPKWVIRRYRLHEVTERLARGVACDWGTLAADLGYADQAHFVRDFKKLFGETPTRYAERY